MDGWGSDSETSVNEKMFDNCLRATIGAGSGKLERVLLQLGEKVRDMARKLLLPCACR